MLLVVAGAVSYFVYDAYFKEEPEPTPETEMTEEAPVIEVEGEVIEDGKGGTVTEEPEKKVPQYEGEDANLSEELTGSVTYAGVLDGVLMVRVNIDQFLASGECELTLTQNGVNIYNTVVPITQSASTATCQGFNVDASKFIAGATQIMIKMSSGGKNGIIYGEVDL